MAANTITATVAYDVLGNAITQSFTFLTMRGPVGIASYAIDEIQEQPGVFGVAYMLNGFKGDPFDLITDTGCDGAANVAIAKLAYASLKGSLVQVTDCFNTSWNLILVLDVQALDERKIACGCGDMATYDHLLTCRWRLRPTATYY